MPLLIAVVVGIAIYGWLCYLAMVYVVVPLLPYVVVGSGGVGVLLLVGVLAGTLLGVGTLGASTVTPSEVRERLPGGRSKFERDSAWPNYLFGQSRTDLGTAIEHTNRVVSRMWAALVKVIQNEPLVLAAWPLWLLVLTATLTLTTGLAVAGVLVYALLGLVLATMWLAWLAAAGLLRGVDLGVRMSRRAQATCHHSECNYRTRLPAYLCRCGRTHHDIRAGRLGAFVRRCECDRLLPTTVLMAAAGLVPVCQKCDRPLRAGAAVLTDIVVPVFGPSSAGKTRLVLAGMVALGRHLTAAGGALQPVGPESEATYREATTVVESRAQTTKTDAARPPAGITVRLSAGKRRALLHMFDAAGEFFANREQNSQLTFLDDAQGLMFVVDPFSIPAVADDLSGVLAPRLAAAQPARDEPEQSYLVTAQRLRDQGVTLDRKPLAVAVVKADLLLGLPPAEGLSPDSGSAEVESWLRERGLDNMVEGASRDFDVVRYFLVSSLDIASDPGGTVGATSPAQPLLWLLGRSGMPIRKPGLVATS